MFNACCCASCVRCQDGFDRSNNTDVTSGQPSGCTGSEESGSWSIDSNALSITAQTNARIRVVTAPSSGSLSFGHLQVKVNGSNSGDKAMIILTSTSGTILLTCLITFGGALRIHGPSGAFYVEGGSIPVSTWTTITLRLMEGDSAGITSIYAEVDGTPVASSMLSTTTALAGTRFDPDAVLLGTGNVCAGTVLFDDLLVYEFAHATTGTGTCARPIACGWPLGTELPNTIYALVEDATSGTLTSPPCDQSVCDSINGLYVLTRVTPNSAFQCAKYEQTGLSFICQFCTDIGAPAATKAVVVMQYVGTAPSFANPRWTLGFSIGDAPIVGCVPFQKGHNVGETDHAPSNPIVITTSTDQGGSLDQRCDAAPSKVTLYT